MNPFSDKASAKASVTFYLIVHYRLNYCRRRRHLCRCHHHFPHSTGAHDILESMAQYTDSFDIRDSGIWFFGAIFDRDHRLCSNKNCTPTPVLAGSRDNAANDSPTIKLYSAIFKSTFTIQKKIHCFYLYNKEEKLVKQHLPVATIWNAAALRP